MLSALPIPPEEWLAAFNEECRKGEIASGERPFRALEAWARLHGQNARLFELMLSHLATPAFEAIYAFFKSNTSLGREQSAPFRQTCFFYDTAFWAVIVPLVFGSCTVDPIRFLVGMPPALFHDLGFNSAARDELDAHWFDCSHHMNNHRLIDGDELPELSREFLAGAEKSLLAVVDSLLAVPPNQKAGELSRDGFESTLKGFAVATTGLTLREAKDIRHNLPKLIRRCGPQLPAAERERIEQASLLYPQVDARYAKGALPIKRLWQCYREAQHAMAISLTIIGQTGLRNVFSSL